ncbi:MAG TPA: prepilin-type N-terminal cleavage/methylation domain-containing protein [Symbiobacteriaceae bacterium]|nr:prepilin-type N-terminal cleavage/methylation domain-containing protein [Symbiobacteriaceae bacterium]
MRLRTNQSGVTLVELVAGIAIASVVLLAVASMEISSWRYRRTDEKAFAAQAEATTLLDRFARDVREARGYTLTADGAGTITVNAPEGPVTYQWTQQTVTRQGRVLMRDVTALQIYREDGGRTLRAVVTAGSGLRLESKATTRLSP